MNSTDVDGIWEKASRGMLAIVGRQVAVKFIGLIGGVALARLLTPEIFGIFAIATFAVAAFSLFNELGLGASLIQKQDNPAKEDLEVMFTAQLGLVGFITLSIMVCAPVVAALYDLSESHVWLIRGVGFISFIGVFRNIPYLLIHRSLEFGKLARVEVVNVAVYTSIAVGAALWGLGVWSFFIAILARGAVDLIQVYLIAPWKPRLRLDFTRLKAMLRFGLVMQGITFLAFAKDNISSALVGLVNGVAAVGYLNWTIQYAGIPVYLVNSLMGVCFPSFSRLQHDGKELAKRLGFIIRIIFVFGIPISTLLAGLAFSIVPWVYTAKWAPAIPSVYAITFNMIGSFLTGPLFTVLYALGCGKKALILFFAWVLATWCVSFILVFPYGFLGVAVSYSLVTTFIAIWITRVISNMLMLDIWGLIKSPILSGICMGAVLIFFTLNGEKGLVDTILWAIFAIGAYVGVLALLDKMRLRDEIFQGFRFFQGLWGVTREHSRA